MCRWDRSCKKDVSLHGTRISASLPAFLSYCCSDCSSGEGSGGRCHDGGNSLLFLPLVTVWRVGKLWASTVDAPGPLAVRLSWVGLATADAALWPAAPLLDVAVPAALSVLKSTFLGTISWVSARGRSGEERPLPYPTQRQRCSRVGIGEEVLSATSAY